MLETEIVIVGAGICGNYLAYLLRQKQIPCIILEKQKSFLSRPLQCAGIISQKILDLVEFPPEIILNQVFKVEMVEPTGQTMIMQGKEQPIIIDRIKFDAYFGQEAQKMGAIFLFSEKYLNHKRGKTDDVIVVTSKRKIRCKYVIGADGPGSKVRKQFNHKISWIPAAQARIPIAYPIHQTTMVFDVKWKELFAYIVPEGNSSIARIGIASKKHPGKNLDLYLNRLNLSKSDIISRQGGLIPYGVPSQLLFEKTALIGDAAGMVKATTGGGIIIGVSAAKILSKAIVKAHQSNDFSQRHFKRHYQTKFQLKLGLELKIHYIIRLFLLNFTNQEFKTLFHLYLHTSVGKIIQTKADMDFPLNMIINLLKNPVFIQFVVKIFLNHFKLIPNILQCLLFSKSHLLD